LAVVDHKFGHHINVIPAKAGIQSFQWLLDFRFRGNDEIAEANIIASQPKWPRN
jgi:hypothetical protein